MATFLNKVRTTPQHGGRPPAAVEITSNGALAALRPSAVAKRGDSPTRDVPVYAFAALPLGALVPGIHEPNLRAPEAVAEAIGTALEQVSPRSRAITLIVPDEIVRVFVLDFDSLPAKIEEAIPVIRFRLRKMVPFDIEHAGLSYQVLAQSKNEWKVLIAVMPGPILAEYEAALRTAGYEPGSVLSSSLASLEIASSMEAVLAANLSEQGITTFIANGQDLLLYRTVDLPADRTERIVEIQRSIAVAAAYYEDKLGAPVQRLYYAGNRDIREFAGWIREPELEVVELAPQPEGGLLTSLGQQSIAGVAGALSGAS